MRRNSGGSFLWIIFLLIFLGMDGLFPLMLIAGMIAAVSYFAVRSSTAKNPQQTTYTRPQNQRNTYNSKVVSHFTPAELAKVNVYLRKYFANNVSLPVSTNIDLRVSGGKYSSLSSMRVYRDNTYICNMEEFNQRYPESAKVILSELLSISSQPISSAEVFDAEVNVQPEEKETVSTNTNKKEEKKETIKDTRTEAQRYVAELNSLNNNIPDEEITNGLYETTALLKQIDSLEKKFPASKTKLAKLYEYYLPILVRILKQYDNLQDAKSDPNYGETRERLNKTINLINDAMQTIISSMTDEDFINLSADMSTLEAVLQKDGLAGNGRIDLKNGAKDEFYVEKQTK